MPDILTWELDRRSFLSYSAMAVAWGFLSYAGLGKAFAAEKTLSSDKIAKIDELKARLKSEGYNIDSLIDDENFEYSEKIERIFNKRRVKNSKRTYTWYRQALNLEDKIKKAPDFMAKYEHELNGAEKKYGVDKRFVVAILGVESDFANDEHIGDYKAFNSIVTQYVIGRKRFAFRELKHLIKFSKNIDRPIFDFYSSYAGAIGYAQFIPSSLNSLFVGKKGKAGKADPMDVTDCIYSVAHYLKRSRWDNKQSEKATVRHSKNWKAIYAYNHSDWYVRAVSEIAYSL